MGMSLEQRLRCVGLDEAARSEEMLERLIRQVLECGYTLEAYRGAYVNGDVGPVQLIVRTREEEGKVNVFGLDVHLPGNAMWDLRVRMRGTTKEPLAYPCLARSASGGEGDVEMLLLNADVLPDLDVGRRFRAQVVAMARHVAYFPDGAAYEAHFGKRAIPEGKIRPVGRRERRVEADAIYERRSGYSAVRGRVTALHTFEWHEEDGASTRIHRATVETDFGPLEIVHPERYVPEAQRGEIRVGATVSCICAISGDVAIDAYDFGAVRDAEHGLRALADALCACDERKARRLLAPDAEYVSDWNEKTFRGVGEILAHIRQVAQIGRYHYEAVPATVTALRGEGRPPHGVGSRCMRLHAREDGTALGLLFAEFDEAGAVTRFEVTYDDRYLVTDDPEDGLPALFGFSAPTRRGETAEVLRAFEESAYAALRERLARLREALPAGVDFEFLKTGPAEQGDFAHCVFRVGARRCAVIFEGWDEEGRHCHVQGLWRTGFAEQCERLAMLPCVFPMRGRREKAGAPLEIRPAGPKPFGLLTPDRRPLTLKRLLAETPGDIPLTDWERAALAIRHARDFLARTQGRRVLRATAMPGIAPNLWFRDASGEICWVRVVFAEDATAADWHAYPRPERRDPRLLAHDGYFLAIRPENPGPYLRGRDDAPAIRPPALQRVYVHP